MKLICGGHFEFQQKTFIKVPAYLHTVGEEIKFWPYMKAILVASIKKYVQAPRHPSAAAVTPNDLKPQKTYIYTRFQRKTEPKVDW